jgi:signal transduction histidine kinase
MLNSIESMPAGGELHITLAHGARFDDDHVEIEIRDTGHGIPESMLETIFDPFITTKPKGSGLGLSICRGIVEAHRGSLRIANSPIGAGAVALVSLPASARSTIESQDIIV